MERLTWQKEFCDSDFMDDGMAKYMNKLAHYEDLEEQGRLKILPCKPGDTIYKIYQFPDDKRIVITQDVVWFIRIEKDSSYIKTLTDWRFNVDNFGKTIFLTEEEAEQALAEMQKG